MYFEHKNLIFWRIGMGQPISFQNGIICFKNYSDSCIIAFHRKTELNIIDHPWNLLITQEWPWINLFGRCFQANKQSHMEWHKKTNKVRWNLVVDFHMNSSEHCNKPKHFKNRKNKPLVQYTSHIRHKYRTIWICRFLINLQGAQ